MGNFMWNMGMTGFGHEQSSIFPGGIGVPSFPKKKRKSPAQHHRIESPEEESQMEQPEDEDLEDEEQDFSEMEEPDSQEDESNSEYRSESGKEYDPKSEQEQTFSLNLQEAVVWAEILGDPVSRKRRKKRAGQLYGNQGYVGRR